MNVLYQTHALRLFELGYLTPVPVVNGKHFAISGKGIAGAFSDNPPNAEQIRSWGKEYPNAGIGMLGGNGIILVDLDDVENIDALLEAALQILGPTPLRRIGQAPKVLLVYSGPKIEAGWQLGGAGQLLARGQHASWFAIHPKTNRPYEWIDKSPFEVPFVELPAVTIEQLRDFQRRCAEISGDASFGSGGAVRPLEGIVISAERDLLASEVDPWDREKITQWAVEKMRSALKNTRHDTAMGLRGLMLRYGCTSQQINELRDAFNLVTSGEGRDGEFVRIQLHYRNAYPADQIDRILGSGWRRWPH
jgi:hypothetical protein